MLRITTPVKSLDVVIASEVTGDGKNHDCRQLSDASPAVQPWLVLILPLLYMFLAPVLRVPKLVLLFLMGCKEVKHQLFFFYMQWIGADIYASNPPWGPAE